MAFEVVRRVLGLTVEHYDTAGRQGVVDGLIHLQNGQLAALEVTSASAPGERELLARLAQDQHSWPNPGRWWWRIQIDDARLIAKAKLAYVQAIVLCEANGVMDPEDLPWRVLKHAPQTQWLLEQGVTLKGHPDVAAEDQDGTRRQVMVTPSGSGGAVDERLEGLRGSLADVFATEPVARRLQKLAATKDVAQRHLYLIVSVDALSFGTGYGLSFSEGLPPDAPPLPDGVEHLWLAPTYGRRVLV